MTGLPLPPNTIIIRWGTWIRTAIYYSLNYSKVVNFINSLAIDSKSIAIKIFKALIQVDDLSNDFLVVSEMEFMVQSITKLETEGLRISEQLEIQLNDMKSKLKGQALIKLNQSLLKNPDLKSYTNEKNNYDHKLQTKYAPLVSVEVERSFSIYKSILTDRRQNSTETTIEHFNVVKYNNFMFQND